jgi:antitoxin ParD1/3/4
MVKNTSVVLGDFEQFINSQIASERYGSVSEVIRARLRLLEHGMHPGLPFNGKRYRMAT